MSILSESVGARLSHGFVLAAISGRHCRALRTSRGDALLRTITTRWSFEKPGTVAVVATLRLHPMTPSTSPIVTRLRATLNSCTSVFVNVLSYLTTVHESPGGIGKYQFWNLVSARSGGTPALPMRSSVTASPSALLNRTVMNQSRTNELGFEKKMAVLLTATTVPGTTASGSTSYVSGRMSGLATALDEGTGVGVGRYSGASTLHPDSTAARRAPVRARRIASSLDPRGLAAGG